MPWDARAEKGLILTKARGFEAMLCVWKEFLKQAGEENGLEVFSILVHQNSSAFMFIYNFVVLLFS